MAIANNNAKCYLEHSENILWNRRRRHCHRHHCRRRRWQSLDIE